MPFTNPSREAPNVHREKVVASVLREVGRRLHYTVSGTGPPLIALHGFGATSYAWRYVAPALARDYEVYLVDLVGHGASARSADGCYSLEAQATLVYDLIRERDLRNVSLIGNSLGGGVALTLALRMASEHDERLSTLVLLDSIYKAPIPFIFKVLRTPFWGRLAMSLPARVSVSLALWYVTVSHIGNTDDVVSAYAANLSTPGGKEALIETIRQIDLDGIDEIINNVRSLDVRTLIIWGRGDPLLRPAIGEQLHRDLRNSSYCVIDKCGHLPQEEMPEVVISCIREFLLRH
jgi:pimeloyl-ACP methyl ester carboxylesterase